MAKTPPLREYRHFTHQHMMEMAKIIRNSDTPMWAKEKLVKGFVDFFLKEDPLLNVAAYKTVALSTLEE